MQAHLNPAGMTVHGLIHRIIEQFPDKMMQPGRIHPADIHAGPFANRVKALKNGNILCRVGLLLRCHRMPLPPPLQLASRSGQAGRAVPNAVLSQPRQG